MDINGNMQNKNKDEEMYEAFERFCIQTIDGNVGDIEACKYIQKKYGRATAVKIWEKWCKK